MCAAACDQIERTRRPMRASAFVAGAKVVDARGARGVDVRADHHWCARAHCLDEIRTIDLMKMNNIRFEGQRFTNSRSHRRVVIKQIRTPIHGNPGKVPIGLDARSEHAHIDAVLGKECRACLNVSRDTAISGPSRHS